MAKTYFEERGEDILVNIGMTKSEFARRMGILRQNVGSLFKSKNLETIHRAAEVMGVPFELLIGYTSEPDIREEKADITAENTIPIRDRIYMVRGVQVMIDYDLAELYGIENRVLRQAVRRNSGKFPDDFLFRLTSDEFKALTYNRVSQTVIPPGYNTGGAQTYAFSEQGVAMLATVLRSKNAVETSIAIMRAFVTMRHFLLENASVFQRIEKLESRQADTDEKVERIFRQLESGAIRPRQGIFYDGQIYDAYAFACNLVRAAKREIILWDNYVNEEVLTLLDKRSSNVKATIYTKNITKQLQLDLARHNAQYAPIGLIPFGKAHDRFLIIDDCVYHIGASLKDLGKSWFAFSKMEDLLPEDLLGKL